MSAPEQIEEAQRRSDKFRSIGLYLLIVAAVLLGASVVTVLATEFVVAGYLLGYVGSAILVLASVLYAAAGVLVPVAEWYAQYHTPRQE